MVRMSESVTTAEYPSWLCSSSLHLNLAMNHFSFPVLEERNQHVAVNPANLAKSTDQERAVSPNLGHKRRLVRPSSSEGGLITVTDPSDG